MSECFAKIKFVIFTFEQDQNICSPNQTRCSSKLRAKDFGCHVSCTGLFADVSHIEGNLDDVTKDGATILDSEVLSELIADYQAYKRNTLQNIKFNATNPTLGMLERI